MEELLMLYLTVKKQNTYQKAVKSLYILMLHGGIFNALSTCFTSLYRVTNIFQHILSSRVAANAK